MKSSITLAAFFMLLLIAALMGANHVAARFAFNDSVNVVTAVFFRSIVTAVIICILLLRRGISMKISKEHRVTFLTIGALIAIQSYCIYSSVSLIPVVLALLAFNTHPLWTALWSRILYRRKAEPLVLKSMPIILFGLALALDVFGTASGLGAAAQWRSIGEGVFYALLGAASFGLALVLTEHKTSNINSLVRTAYTLAIVTALATLLGFFQGGLTLPISTNGWLGLVGLTILYGTGFTMMFSLLPRLGVVGNSAIMNVEPIFALVFAWILLDQKISITQIVGALIVVGAVIVIGLRKKRQ
jgi:drug/metabolite transporter (DMT)-like permease